MLPAPSQRPGCTAASAMVEDVKSWVQSGRLSPGLRLPAVRVLADHFGIDKNTAGRACRTLMQQGVLRRHGNGNRAVLMVPEAGGLPLAGTFVLVTACPPEQLSRPVAPGRGVRIVAGALAALRSDGRHVLLAQPHALQPEQFRQWGGLGLGGAVLLDAPGPAAGEVIADMRQLGIPVTVYGDTMAVDGCDLVVSDHRAGAGMVVAFLAQRGCRRLLPALPELPGCPWTDERRAGWREAAANHGCELLPEVLLSGGEAADETAWNRRNRLIAGELAESITGPAPPDAILTINDGHAAAVRAACALLHHPELPVAGYDDLWADLSEYERRSGPPVCSVDKNNEEIGRALAELAMERRAGRLPEAPQLRIIAPKLVTGT